MLPVAPLLLRLDSGKTKYFFVFFPNLYFFLWETQFKTSEGSLVYGKSGGGNIVVVGGDLSMALLSFANAAVMRLLLK